jgi:hypothetical protein
MKVLKHGLTIGINRVENEFFLTLKAVGKLTHEDYEKITPLIDNALNGVRDAKVKVFIDGTELEGWELRAAWDDLKLGLKHGGQFDKIAIYGNKKWQEYVSKVASWFISGESKFFEDESEAFKWLKKL